MEVKNELITKLGVTSKSPCVVTKDFSHDAKTSGDEEGLRQVIRELELDLEEVWTSRMDALEEVHKLQEMLSEMNGENDELVSDMQMLMDDCDDLKRQNDDIVAEKASLEAKLQKAHEEVALCHETIEEQRTRRLKPHEVDEAVRNVKESYERKLRHTNNERNEMEKMVEQLSEELELMRDQMFAVMAENKVFQKRNKGIQGIIKQCETCSHHLHQMNMEIGNSPADSKRRPSGIAGLKKMIGHQMDKPRRNTWSEAKNRQASLEELPSADGGFSQRLMSLPENCEEPKMTQSRSRRRRSNNSAVRHSTGNIVEVTTGGHSDEEEPSVVRSVVGQPATSGKAPLANFVGAINNTIKNRRSSDDQEKILEMLSAKRDTSVHRIPEVPQQGEDVDDDRSFMSAPVPRRGLGRFMNNAIKRNNSHRRNNSRDMKNISALAALLKQENQANRSNKSMNEHEDSDQSKSDAPSSTKVDSGCGGDRTLVSAPPVLQPSAAAAAETVARVAPVRTNSGRQRRQPFLRLGSLLRKEGGGSQRSNSSTEDADHTAKESGTLVTVSDDSEVNNASPTRNRSFRWNLQRRNTNQE